MHRRHLASFAAVTGLVAGGALVAGPASAATPDCGSYQYVRTGTVAAGQTVQPFQYFFTIKNPGPVELCLDGPDGADVELTLNRLESVGDTVVATAPSGGADKTISYTGPIAAYRAYVIGVSGGGSYTLGLSMP